MGARNRHEPGRGQAFQRGQGSARHDERRLVECGAGARGFKAFAERAEKAGIQRQAENSFFLPVEVQRRDMTVASATGGGNMVATDLRPQDFIGLLRARTWCASSAPAT